MLEIDKVYEGDCIDVLQSIDDSSIDLIITSPPYFVDKSYEKEISFGHYCLLMERSFLSWARILRPGRYVIVNFGDYFNSNNRFYRADVPSCYPATINYFHWGVEIADFDLQATRIWRKQFSKMKIPFVCNSHPRPVFDYEHIWTFRKKNGSKKEFVNDRRLSQRGVIGDEWTSPARLKEHCAAFPIELPLWAINVYSNCESDLVLDPFAGSGTTARACKQTKRHFILIEKNSLFCELSRSNLDIDRCYCVKWE